MDWKIILTKLKAIKNAGILLIILTLIVMIYFKNNKIANLQAKLNEKPTIEYVYTPAVVDTIRDTIPEPYEVIKWKKGDVITNTIYEPLDLTLADSAQIADSYNKLYGMYAEAKMYDDTLKNDTTAFIRLKEKVQFNSIYDRELIFENKTPIVKITDTKIDKTFSIVAGLDGNSDGISLGAGAITNKNVVYLIKYNPWNKTAGGAVYFPIFNF